MFFSAPPADEAERFFGEHGLDACEISLPIDTDRIPDHLRRNIIACGERFPGRVQLHEVIPLTLAHRSAEFRARITTRLKEDILLARDAGVPLITLHTTCTRTRRPLRRDWRKSRTRWVARALDLDVTTDFDESVRVLVGTLEELHAVADPSRGPRVLLAVENNFRDTKYFGRRIDTIDDVVSVLEKAALSCARLCLDIFKAHSTEPSIAEALHRAAPWIVNVHASDAEPAETAFFRKRAPIGDGEIDWAPVVEALRDIHYTGAIIFEMMTSVDDVRTSVQRLRALLDDTAEAT